MYFHDFAGLFHVFFSGIFAYAILVVFLRISGKRTLSKMNSFDFVVTIALGSTLAATIVNTSIPLLEGMVAMGVLVGMQYLVTLACIRDKNVKRVVTGEPSLLFYQGDFLSDRLQETRVMKDEVISIIRSAGCATLKEAHAVVLETDGSLSVVKGGAGAEDSSLQGMNIPGHESSGEEKETPDREKA